MQTSLPDNMNYLKSIPPELDTFEEVSQILDFTLKSIEKDYGFEGVGLQLVDYEKKILKFYKLHIPHIPEETLKEIENMEIPYDLTGGISVFVAQQNLVIFFDDVLNFNPEYYSISDYDRKSIDLLKHRTHLIVPIDFEKKVIALLHLSSFSKIIHLEKNQIERIKDISTHLGRVFYKTLSFKKIYEEKQSLILEQTKAREARDNLLAGISHELKTPLNAIIGFSDYLSKIKDTDTQKIHKIADIIHKNGKQLLTIIQEIIELYKINSGKIKINYSQIDARQLVKYVLASLEPLYLKKKHKISMKIENFFFQSDYNRIFQILTNLLSNAVKYTNPDGKILISAFIQEEKAWFTIKDNGIGIDEDEMKTLFTPFTRGKRASEKEEGSGLGLFLTHELVKILEGKIKVKSKKNSGSSFILIFPLEKKTSL